MIKTLWEIFSEIFSMIGYPLSFIIKPPPEKQQSGDKQVILIVERWFNHNFFHNQWIRYLRKKGFCIYFVNFPLYKGNFAESSLLLKNYIIDNKLKNIILVGISAGGVTSLLYLEEQNGWQYVKKFIAVGSPLKGNAMSLFISFIYSARELFPWSTFIKRLKRLPLSHPERIVCMRALFDQLVPATSSVLPGAKERIVTVVGHNNFHLHCKETYDIIAEEARK